MPTSTMHACWSLAAIGAVMCLATEGRCDDNTVAVSVPVLAPTRSLLTQPQEPPVRLGGLLQTRYTFSHTRDGENNEYGFSLPRVRLWARGDVTDSVSFYIRGQFSGEQKAPGFEEESIGGVFELDRAYVNFALDDRYSLRIGQVVSEMSRENEHAPQDQVGVNASATDSVFGLGGFQGVQLHGRFDDWRFWGTFSDGSRDSNTDFGDPDQADFGLTGKVDYKLAGEWSRFSNMTSFRGSDFAAMLGLGAHWENGGVAGDPAESIALVQVVGEASLEADGWNVYAALHWANSAFQVDSPVNDFGVVVQGGYFLAERLEAYARYDAVLPDPSRADDPVERGGQFQTVTAGFNYYFIPESNALKFSIDAQYFFDSERDSLVQPSTRTSVRESDRGGQYALRAQLTAVF